MKTWNKTFNYIKRLADLITFGKIAQVSGKEIQTAEAWGREPESNENPHGTGKRNPLDLVIRLIGLAHKEDAGLAREIAELFVDYVNFLDDAKGVEFISNGGCPYEILSQSVKEHADIVISMLQTKNPDWTRIYTEIVESESKHLELKACIKEKLKVDIGEARNAYEQMQTNHFSNGKR